MLKGLAALPLAGGPLSCGVLSAPHGPGVKAPPSLDDFNISADGQTVVFQYHLGDFLGGLGVYAWRTGNLIRIPNPPGMELSGASFSYDGRRIAAVMSRQTTDLSVAVVDLATMDWTQLTEPLRAPAYVVYPVFQPGTDRVLYCECRYPYPTGLKLIGINDRKQETILPENEGFFRLYRPSFISVNKVYFSGIAPHFNPLRRQQDQAGLTGLECSFQLQFGGVPDYVFPNLIPDIRHRGNGFADFSASRDGKMVIALGTNLTTPAKPTGETNYEVFSIDPDGRPLQLTNLFGYLGHCRVSYDGSAVCFGSRAGRNALTALNILDLRTNRVTVTDLHQQIRAREDFAT